MREDGGEVSSLLAFVLDVTERKRAERSECFLADLSARLGSASEEDEIVRTTLEALSSFLRVSSACFVECHLAENRVLISGQRGGESPGSFSGRYDLQQLGGADWWHTQVKLGIADAERATLAPELGGGGAGSYATQAVSCPGGWCVALTVASTARRVFRRDELSLLPTCWREAALVERARSESALESESDRRHRLFETILSGRRT